MNNYVKSATRIILSLAFLNTLYACDSGNTGNTTSVARTEIPAAIQKLTIGAGTLTASVTIGTRTEPMIIDTSGTGSATANFPSLTLENHTVVITYYYTVGADIAILATATKDVDLSVTTTLNFIESDYIFTYDFDGDGTNNATELADGTDPFIDEGAAGGPCVLGTSTLGNCTL